MGAWQREIKLLLLLLLAAMIAGLVTDQTKALLFLVTLVALISQIRQITRFENWIKRGGKGAYPKAKGIWEEIYYHVYRLKKAEKRRKKKLSKIINQFRQSTEALPDAAVVMGENDEIEWTNKAAQDVLGLESSDKGHRIPNLIRFPDFIRYLKEGDYSDSVVIPSPVNSHIILSVRIVAYGPGLRLLLAQDVTQLKKMERMRKDFVANVSHELRTPLTVLKGYLETLHDFDNGDSPLLTNSLQQMQSQTERMEHLVEDLLLLTHLETHQTQKKCIDMPQLLAEVCKDSEAPDEADRRVQLILESNAHLNGNEQELRSAVSNLINNALKYSPENAPVTVRWYETDRVLRLEVEDKGEGIAAIDIPRVTERFYRVDVKRSKKVNGTGLGLAIVKHVLMRHDAELDITSQLGKGSLFRCRFPATRRCN